MYHSPGETVVFLIISGYLSRKSKYATCSKDATCLISTHSWPLLFPILSREVALLLSLHWFLSKSFWKKINTNWTTNSYFFYLKVVMFSTCCCMQLWINRRTLMGWEAGRFAWCPVHPESFRPDWGVWSRFAWVFFYYTGWLSDWLYWITQLKAFVEKGRISLFWSIFIFCRIELIFGRLTCFDMKSIVP